MFGFKRKNTDGEESNNTSGPSQLPSEEKTGDGEAQHLTGAKFGIVFGSLVLTCLVVGLDVAVISTAIPSISSDFNATGDIGWYAASYTLATSALQPLAGKISSVFQIKNVYLAFLTIFFLGSLLCGVATNSNFFIVARAIAGCGAAGLVSNALTIISIVLPLSKRALYTSTLMGMFGISTIAGPLVGGAFTTNVTWRWCFYINLPCIGITFALLFFFMEVPNRASLADLSLLQKIAKLDLLGCFLFVPGVIMALLALQWGGHQYEWDSATIIGLFCGCAGLLAVFFAYEYRIGDEAMIPFSVLTHRSSILICLAATLGMGGFGINVYYLPEWFQVVKKASAIHSGVMYLPAVLSMTIFSPIAGLIINKTGHFNFNLLFGFSLLAVGGGLYSTFTPGTNSAHWIPYQLFQGIGGSFAFGATLIAIQAVLHDRPHLVPLAIALLLFAQYFGIAIWTSIALTIFQNRLIDNLTGAGFNEREISAFLLAGTGTVRSLAEKLAPEMVGEVIDAYNDAITRVFYAAAALASTGALLSLGIEWTSTKQKSQKDEETASVRVEERLQLEKTDDRAQEAV